MLGGSDAALGPHSASIEQSAKAAQMGVVCGACNRRDCEKIPARVELRKVTSR